MFTRIISIIIGLWLMASPDILTMNSVTSNNNHIAGPLVITFSVISLWDINRNVIKANIILGIWLIVACCGCVGRIWLTRASMTAESNEPNYSSLTCL